MTTMSSYTQFGYPYTSASQLLMSSGAPSSGAGPSAGSVGAPSPGGGSGISAGSSGSASVASAGGSGSVAGNVASGATSPCCDSGRPLVTDPVTGQTVCSCQYDRLQALSAYGPSAAAAAAARLAAVSSAVTGVSGLHGIYSNTYPSTDQNPYPSLGMDSTTAFYSSLANPYSLKEGGPAPGDVAGWSGPGLQTAPGYYPYDPTLAAYGYGASYDLAARRKNATRESTATLKAWLSEHKKNPYPTKGEKIMLAIITKMTLTQVSTWFANARRRLKKENKMTWEPKNRNDDDDDDDCSAHSDDESKPIKDKHSKHHLDHHKGEGDDKSDCEDDSRGSMSPHSSVGSGSCAQVNENGVSVSVSVSNLNGCQLNPSMGPSSMGGDLHHLGGVASNQHVKPKIWSLADTAACKTPPPPLPLPHGPSHASAASNGIPAAPPAPHSWFSGVNGCHVNPMATMSSMASMAGGGNMMNGMANMATMGKIGAGFGAYARYPPLPGYHAGGGGYGTGAGHVVHGASGAYGLSSTQLPYACDVQTDTPPQTPPNLKVNGTAGLLGSHQYVSPSAIVANRPNSSMMAAPSANSNSGEHAAAEMAAHLSSPHRQSMAAAMGASSSSHPQTGAASADSTAFRPVYRTSPIGGYATSS